ncbi:MAG: Hsp20/alpha crystallin family protein [Fibrobacter sp.]|nr:Hsp20/alpha crystallin family protein [Fibrobacter sp.]
MNTLIRYSNPSATLSNILDSFFDLNAMDTFFTAGNWPKVDITESDDGYTIKADLPGMDKSDVSIVVDNGVLRIEGERKNETSGEENLFSHYECITGKFSRSFSLPEEIESEHIEAKMANGVLTVALRKTEKAKPKVITVRVE